MIADLPILPPAPADPAPARPGRDAASPAPARFEALVTGDQPPATEDAPAPPQRRPVRQAPPNGDPGLVAAVVQLPLPVQPVEVPVPAGTALAAGPVPPAPGQQQAAVPGPAIMPTAAPGTVGTAPAQGDQLPVPVTVQPPDPGDPAGAAQVPKPLAGGVPAGAGTLPAAAPTTGPSAAGGLPVASPAVAAETAAPAAPPAAARPGKPVLQAPAADPARPAPVMVAPTKKEGGAEPLATVLPAGSGAAAIPAAPGGEAIHAPHRPAPASPPPPSAQVMAKLEPALAEGRPTTLTLRLTPEELGRVEVRIEVQDGKVNALVAADRQSTLDLLQRDARGMERALEQGGLKLQPDGLQFSLRDAPRQDQPGQQPSPQGGRAYRLDQAEVEPGPLAPIARRLDGLVDIQV